MDDQDRSNPVARARDLKAAIAAASDVIETTRRLPEPLVARLHEARLFRMLLPRSCGGDQLDPVNYFSTIEELSRHDGSTGWVVFVANSSALIAAYLEPTTARTIFADPCSTVAWGPPNAARASAGPGGYRVSGTWDFASGCRHASWMGAHCQVIEPDGSLRRDARGKLVLRTLLFPAREATVLDTWHTIGLCGTGSESYRVDDVFVPEAFSGARADPTYRMEKGPLYAFTMPGLYAVGVAAVAMGIAGAMFEAFVALAGTKAPRNLSRLADNAVVQAEVARAEAKLGAARAYLIETLASIYAGADDVEAIEVADRARVRLACTNAIQGAIEVADFAYKAAGVDAIFPGSPFERRFRDMHTLSQQIQSRTAHYEEVGQVLLGMPPEGFL
ncbi:MAG: acyl-CoA dehydrogenase family protein [Hyphomicrobiales bacterium]|nr:acyl-CoA dehydrogenase family protein [Hyphomicrobiales bacterium]MBV9428078.1 acyl-CoA dehydrogenase family protein [Bradyrhizobiaceae bacterium]